MRLWSIICQWAEGYSKLLNNALISLGLFSSEIAKRRSKEGMMAEGGGGRIWVARDIVEKGGFGGQEGCCLGPVLVTSLGMDIHKERVKWNVGCGMCPYLVSISFAVSGSDSFPYRVGSGTDETGLSIFRTDDAVRRLCDRSFRKGLG